jgi:hypothetical protein
MTDFNIRLQQKQHYKIISLQGGLQVPARLEDLIDVSVDTTNKKDKYVLMYDVNLNKYKLVNPDDVLSAATNEPIQPGLPADFQNQLDIDLDDRIDLDAGTF